MDRLQELVRLHRMGTGARSVARLLVMSPNTERRYRDALSAAGLLFGAVANRRWRAISLAEPQAITEGDP